MHYPSLDEAKQLAAQGDYRRIPVARELLSDVRTPVEVLRVLQERSHHCFLFESAEDSMRWGRYSFLGFDPVLEVTCTAGELRVRSTNHTAGTSYGCDSEAPTNCGFEASITQNTNSATPGEYTTHVDHPADILRRIVADWRSPRIEDMPTFTGGLVGYFSYDYLRYAEPTLSLATREDEGFKDVDLMLFDKVIAFDNYRRRIVLIANADATNLDESYPQALRELDELADLLRSCPPPPARAGHMKGELKPLFDEDAYCAMVEEGKKRIREGDIFQVVLSNRLEAEFEGSLLDTYRLLVATNPAPYLFYFTSDDIEIAGASPETLVRLEDGVLHTFPLAGTRPRGATPEEDRALEEGLLTDEKELAEHNMLVDLGRNDLGKVSKFGTVEVEDYLSILRFSRVMHIGSTVRGQIRDDCDAFDAIEAVLPAGTLSGAPKYSACQTIDELEGCKRGIYGGAVGYIDLSGNMDVCIAIRLAFKKNGHVYVRTGAGIVADSVPKNEYQECINKAKAVTNALAMAEDGGLL